MPLVLERWGESERPVPEPIYNDWLLSPSATNSTSCTYFTSTANTIDWGSSLTTTGTSWTASTSCTTGTIANISWNVPAGWTAPYNTYNHVVLPPPREPTEADRERLRRAEVVRQEREERWRRNAAARVHANSRAEELLLAMLNEAQRRSYRLNGTFEVIGSHGNLYRIHRGKAGNVEWIKPDGKFGGKLCAHPTERDDWLPVPDVMLAQMVDLITDERAFIRVANVHQGDRPRIQA